MLAKKLHLKSGMRFLVADAPDGFRRTLGLVPDGAREGTLGRGALNLMLMFVRSKKELRDRWPKALAALKEDGLLWVAYPKKSSGIPSDLTGMDSSWEVYRGSPWEPVSSISVDETWSAVRFKYGGTDLL